MSLVSFNGTTILQSHKFKKNLIQSLITFLSHWLPASDELQVLPAPINIFQIYCLLSIVTLVRPSLGPCYLCMGCHTNLLTALSTSYQLFFTPKHLKIADGFILLK